MPEVTGTVAVDAPPERVWAALVDWSRQGEWMVATDVRPVVGPAQGVGGRLVAVTGIPRPGGGRVGVVDTMTISGWERPYRVDVEHTGRLIRGTGVFEIRPAGDGVVFRWTERLDLPLGRVGRLAWPLVEPAVRAALRLSLRRFAEFAPRHPPSGCPHGRSE